MTWRRMLNYTLLTPERVVFGVGFGPNIVHEAGATAIIGGSIHPDVRSPHDFPLTAFTRTGVVGLLALAVFVLELGVSAWRVVRVLDELRLLCVLVILGLAVASLVGVVMEAPFGAVPAYWCAGVLLSRPWHSGRMVGRPNHRMIGWPIHSSLSRGSGRRETGSARKESASRSRPSVSGG